MTCCAHRPAPLPDTGSFMLRKHLSVPSVLAAAVLALAPLGARAQEGSGSTEPAKEQAPSSGEAPTVDIAPVPEPAPATEVAPATEAEAAPKKMGFYFGMSMQRLSQLGQANGIGLEVDGPAVLGGSYSATGKEIDGDLRSRWSLGFTLGFRLRNDNGNVEARFFQWDEQEDLFQEASAGKAIANTLASPSAGYAEDLGQFLQQGPPDGLSSGAEAGTLSEGSEAADPMSDGAEDLNYNRTPDFIRFGTSDAIVGEVKTDFKLTDIDYVRTLQRFQRFTLDGRAGIRVASLDQLTDLGYREFGSFAVFTDDEGAVGTTERRTGSVPGGCGYSAVQDGDGDGESGIQGNEKDGDGFMDGNCNATIGDRLTNVQTVSEDRIITNISSAGIGLNMGVDGRFELTKKWRLSGSIGMSLLSAETEFRYRETFTSERDRYANFIDWDFNGDGVYNNLDLDFDGSCNGVLTAGCLPNAGDSAALQNDGTFSYVGARIREGAEYTYSSPRLRNPAPLPNALGVNTNAYTGVYAQAVRVGDPVPESERNRDILSETTLLNDISGSASGIQPMLDLHVGLEYQFSRFAHFDFGLKSTHWFGAGSFREIANDVVAGRPVEADGGDFSLTGAYFNITIVPR